ncbi:PEP/pyruvate-binding domain-containing protein, partial [bacterium]|nr:PEP/pyruvate-binding domain-containing protein [bacterium]
MKSYKDQTDRIVNALQERAKELSCLYHVEKQLHDFSKDFRSVISNILKAIPPGCQFPDICQVKMIYLDEEFTTDNYHPSEWKLTDQIMMNKEKVGSIEVSYTQPKPKEDEGPFLKEERKLISTIADRISQFITHQQLRQIYEEADSASSTSETKKPADSKIVIDLLCHTDPKLYVRIARRLLNYLYKSGITATEKILQQIIPASYSKIPSSTTGDNLPLDRINQLDFMDLSQEIFQIAYQHISDQELMSRLQLWMQEDRANALIKMLNDPKATLDDIADEVRRFKQMADKENLELPESMRRNIIVQFIRMLMSSRLGFISTARDCVSLNDFASLFGSIIYSAGSRGRLGGKGSGVFVASKLLEKEAAHNKDLKHIKTPKTKYITTDGLHGFIHYNDLLDIFEQKYKDIEQIRLEYPQIVNIFKSAKFPPDIVDKVSAALDELGDKPLIVRSSSLLEDQLGTAFSGKYRSLFLGNQGTKRERLNALLDAIAEVYASTFSPDPLEYRKERDLLDFQEQMGVLIQEVVGTRVGPYFLPAYAGVAFSNNEFRWS